MAHEGAGLPYPPQPGFTAVPQQDYSNPNSDPRQYQPQGQPVPGPQNFLPAPHMSAVPNIPPGLEYLTQVDQVLIHQKRHSVFQSSLEYEILNAVSQRMFYAQQERECCGPILDVRIYNNSQQHILHLLLPSECCSWATELQVYSPTTGSLIGYIVKDWAAFSISFSILNIAKECVLRVVGPGFSMAAFSDINFEVKTGNESQTVGRITRVWRGLQKELFSPNDHYSVQFPIDLDAKVKALLMSTGIFIDYLYHEANRRHRQTNHHMNNHTNLQMIHHRNHHRNHMNHMNHHRNHHMNHHMNHMNHHRNHR